MAKDKDGQSGGKSCISKAPKVFSGVMKVIWSVLCSWVSVFSWARSLREAIIEVRMDIDRSRFSDVKKTTKYKSFNRWTFPKGFCRVVKESTIFEFGILLAILANTFIDGYTCDYEVTHDGEVPHWTDVVGVFFLTIYTIEFVIVVIGIGPKAYFTDGWSLFDFLILILCYIPYFLDDLSVNLTFLRVFRAMRGVRVFRALSFCAPLKTLFLGVQQTLISAFWLIILLFIFILVLAISALYFFGEKVPDPWGNLATSLLHTFAITTKDAWNVYQDDLDREYGEISRIFSVVVVVVCGLIISSLVVAAVTDNFEDSANETSKMEARIRKQKVAAYRKKNAEKERAAKSKRMTAARESSEKFEQQSKNNDQIPETESMQQIFEPTTSGETTDQQKKGETTKKAPTIKPQKSMFCNPKWMKAVLVVLEKIKYWANERHQYYQQLFECLVELSEMSVPAGNQGNASQTPADTPSNSQQS